MFGPRTWAEELAKFGFVAVATEKLFGTKNPSEAMRRQVRGFIGDVEEADAPAIHPDGERFLTIRGYRRLEPKRFPIPRTDRFTEVLSRNPVRDIHDLRKNAYEIGGVIRGNRLLYYRGKESSVEIMPMIEVAGGLAEGDIMFHTHPGSSFGGLSTSIPSVADIRVHLWASTHLGDGARHIISGSDGLRELRVEIHDMEKWKREVEDNNFWIWLILMDESFRGIVWWETYGIRRALKRLEELEMGGTLIISEPTTPGSEFIPLQPYVAPMDVSAGVVEKVNNLGIHDLRDHYAAEAERQEAPQFRDRDYYIGLLRQHDPGRDWSEAAPTKRRSLELVKVAGLPSGTRWSREELIAHLTGKPVFGKTYLDASRIDFAALLGIDESELTQAVDMDFITEAINSIGDEDVDRIYDHAVAHLGFPEYRIYSLKVAALEEVDPRGDFYGLGATQIRRALKDNDPSRPEEPSEEDMRVMQPEEIENLRRQQHVDALTNVQKRNALTGKPVHGVVLLPDPTIMWWGSFFPGYPSEAPPITPLGGREWGSPGVVNYKSALIYSNRHTHFSNQHDIELRERTRTRPWALRELRVLDYLLTVLPGVVPHIDTVARYSNEFTQYDPMLRRLIVGGEAEVSDTLTALTYVAAIKVLRFGYYDSSATYRGPIHRMPLMKAWLGVEPWRYKVGRKVFAPHTEAGQRAVLSGEGEWRPPSRAASDKSPGDSLIAAIVAYMTGAEQSPIAEQFIRSEVFGGDSFAMNKVHFLGGFNLPIRTRTPGLSRI